MVAVVEVAPPEGEVVVQHADEEVEVALAFPGEEGEREVVRVVVLLVAEEQLHALEAEPRAVTGPRLVRLRGAPVRTASVHVDRLRQRERLRGLQQVEALASLRREEVGAAGEDLREGVGSALDALPLLRPLPVPGLAVRLGEGHHEERECEGGQQHEAQRDHAEPAADAGARYGASGGVSQA